MFLGQKEPEVGVKWVFSGFIANQCIVVTAALMVKIGYNYFNKIFVFRFLGAKREWDFLRFWEIEAWYVRNFLYEFTAA